MFILDNVKRQAGYYNGLLEWLEQNIGYDGSAWDTEVEQSHLGSDRMHVKLITFKNPEHEVLTKLRWG